MFKMYFHEIQTIERIQLLTEQVSHLYGDWNGASIFMFAYNYSDFRLNITYNLVLLRVPIEWFDADLDNNDLREPWFMEIDAQFMPMSNGKLVTDAVER